MRIAETTATRTLLALASTATLALGGALIATCPHGKAATAAPAPREVIKPLRGCGAKAARAHDAGAARPQVRSHGNAYRRILNGTVPTLRSCLPDDGGARQLQLSVNIRESGQVRGIELTERGAPVADDELQTCVLAVMSSLTFPPSPHDVTLTTTLRSR